MNDQDAFNWASDKKRINERKANEIAEAISTSYGRKKLLVQMWFPMERYLIPGETEEQRIERHYQELMSWEEEYRRQDKLRDEDNGKPQIH